MMYVVYQVEFLSDVDGRGAEKCRTWLAEFESEDDAYSFADSYFDYCEVDIEY